MNQTLIKSRTAYNNGYYSKKLQEGLEYQDYVTSELYKHGIILVGYSSKKYQYNKGENLLGAEIKRDGEFRNTGNLYIEIAEKSHPDNNDYIPSGIMRKDNQWLYIIGDEITIYIFSTKYLSYLKCRFKEVTIPTSKGFLIPMKDADKYCINKLEIP